MLMEANWRDKNWNGEVIERGSFVTSQPKLAKRWGWSRSRVQRFLDTLESEQRIEQLANSRRTKIRITNYEQYQEFSPIREQDPDKKPDKKPDSRAGTTKLRSTKELKNKRVDLPLVLEPARASIESWLTYKAELGKSYKPTGLKALIAELEQLGPTRTIAAIKFSMSKNWAGIFEDKSSGRAAVQEPPKSRPEHKVFTAESLEASRLAANVAAKKKF